MKRLAWRVRVRLHDWMWSHPRAHPLARRLPLYLSDPDYIDPEVLKARAPALGCCSHGISIGTSTSSTVTFYGNRIVKR